MLYRSNKLMYDRTTYSLWSQLLGEPVVGPLADSGMKLSFFPVSLTTWGEWAARHPNTTVLSLKTGVYAPSRYLPEEDAGSFYSDYRNSAEVMFPVWNRDTRLDPKDEVLALSIDDVHKAYPTGVLQRERVVNDELGGTEVVIVASASSASARAYLRKGRVFRLPEAEAPGTLATSLVDSNGVTWRVTEEALVNTSDLLTTLPRLRSHISFWFGWYAFHPDTQVYGLE